MSNTGIFIFRNLLWTHAEALELSGDEYKQRLANVLTTLGYALGDIDKKSYQQISDDIASAVSEFAKER